MFDEFASCCAHRLHNELTHATKEDKVVGHVHATLSIMNVATRRRQLEEAFVALVTREFQLLPGPPPVHVSTHNARVIKDASPACVECPEPCVRRQSRPYPRPGRFESSACTSCYGQLGHEDPPLWPP